MYDKEKQVKIFLPTDPEFYRMSKYDYYVMFYCLRMAGTYTSKTETYYPGNMIVFQECTYKRMIEEVPSLRVNLIIQSLNKLKRLGILIPSKDNIAEDRERTYYLNPQYFFIGTVQQRNKVVSQNIHRGITKEEIEIIDNDD